MSAKTSTIERPQPRGINRRGMPLWDGAEVKLWRQSLGVQQLLASNRAGIWASAASAIYENYRTPVAVQYRQMESYLDAIEKEAALAAKAKAEAIEKLAALRLTLPTVVVTDEQKTAGSGGWRTAAEADAIKAAQARGER